jgi:selenocysteine-specific elongation factor
LAIEEAGTEGVTLPSLPVRLGVAPDAVPALVSELVDSARRLGDRLLSARILDELGDRASDALEQFHREQPLEPGVPLQLLRSRLGAPAEVVDAVLERQVRAGRVVLSGAVARSASWAPQLSAGEAELAETLVADLAAAGAEPSSVAELVSRHGPGTVGLLRYLERQSRLVQVESERYYERGALETLLDRLGRHMDGGAEHSPAELREVLGVSRKYLIPLLEFCDRVGYTARLASGSRVWRGRRLGSDSRVAS